METSIVPLQSTAETQTSEFAVYVFLVVTAASMTRENAVLPFHITRMLGWQNKTHGFALVNEQGIRLVFRDVEDIQSKPDEDAESLVIPWENLASLDVRRGILADKMIIEVHGLVGDEPDGKNDNRIELELHKRERDRLDEFERHVQDYQSGRRKDDVDEVIDDIRDFLDRM